MTGKKRVIPWAWSAVVFIGFMTAFVARATNETSSLAISSAAGAPGATVNLDVSLNVGTGTLPASLQWDFNYSSSDLSFVSETGSPAGKSVYCNTISAGDVRCIVSGVDTTTIGSGALATVTFQIAAGTTDNSTLVSLVSALASDGSANALSLTGGGGTVTINQPVTPTLSSLSCSPGSVTPPATSTCTLTLSGAASSTMTIDLSSGSTAATVPTSVNIAAGSSSKNFTVNTSSVSTITTALITATSGSSSTNFSLTLTPGSTCAYSLGTNTSERSSSAGSGSFNVETSAGCAWTVTNSSTFITVTGGGSGAGNGTVSYSVTANSGVSRIGTLTIATQTFTVTQSGQGSLTFYPLPPCRIADTRLGSGFSGAFGTPSLAAGVGRSFPIQASSCNVPATAQAYSLNITVVPPGVLDYLTVWPTGQTTPLVSTLNSLSGEIVANAAIVPAGTGGAISLLASNGTDAIIDINGYFAPTGSQALAFYPLTPCRVVDTRAVGGSGLSGAFGPPQMVASATRSFPIPSSSCGIPSAAEAYSFNMTVVPPGLLDFLTVWPAGQSMPTASTLNDTSAALVANAAIVAAGTSGAVDVFVPQATDLIIDANGYFAPPGSAGALNFYPLTPCRVVDTRAVGGSGLTGAFGPPQMAANGTRSFPIPSSSCGVPATAQAYSLNMTVVPSGPLNYLSTWPTGRAMPLVSTLNDLSGTIVANAAIVPAGSNGAISVFAYDATNLIIDINGYFAP